MAYEHGKVEKKWQDIWEREGTFRTGNDPARPKKYILDMFPYPSAQGLHVGHPEGYTATDIQARYWRAKGWDVLHPMGWDSFGLPAEQFAIKTGKHPRIMTEKNIDNFRRQLKMLGFSYDWEREVATTDEDYVRWTQWIFLQLFKKGLAYECELPVNWSPDLCAVLANEEVEEWRAKGFTVERKRMRQWVLKITAYADRLLEDLEGLDWPESIKEMQRNWIGRSEGAEVDFATEDGEKIRVFTTRPDTLFGATYMVLAPEHPLVDKLVTAEQKAAVEEYREAAKKKSDLERTELAKEKTGVFTGAYAVNPVNGGKIPVWIADYVLWGYGTGAIMAVPAHDERDWDFAKKFGLPIIEVVSGGGDVQAAAWTGDGPLVNSANGEVSLNGLGVEEAKAKITAWLASKGAGEKKVNYKLRDWLFSRQRFWGEPFPLLHCEKCGVVPVDEGELPVRLPEMEDYRPTPDGQPPLARAKGWMETTCPKCGGRALRETNTMPQWAGSCWYYLRYIDPKNATALVDPALEKRWMPVDLYVGGAEHAVLHLLYARFWHKVLFDLGVVSTKEPFQKLVNQGMILGEMEYAAFEDVATGKAVDYAPGMEKEPERWRAVKLGEGDVEKRGEKFVRKGDGVAVRAKADKMSKSRGNVINPDDIVKEYGADALRLYEMFMGPLTQVKPWSTKGVEGVARFLNRVWRLVVDDETGGVSGQLVDAPMDAGQKRALHKVVKKVTKDIESMDYNTAISAMMIFLNEAQAWEKRPREAVETLVQLLAPFAPHIAEELWEKLGHAESVSKAAWPEWDESAIAESEIELPVQVNGKVRGRVKVPADADNAAILAAARANEGVAAFLAGKTLKKEIVVPKRMVNFVAV